MQTDKSNGKIKFKPLHDGVGFHPFSEGLPYAPQSTTPKAEVKPRAAIPSEYPKEPKKDYTRGAGAMSAGTPTFAMPKTTRQMQQQNQKPLVSIPISKPSPKAVAIQEQALLRKRFFAYLLDTVVHIGFWVSVNLLATFGFHIEIDGTLIEKNLFGFVMFFVFSQWLFIAMQEVLFETSVGKFFFGLEFKRNRNSFFSSALFLRSLVFMVGMLAAGIGLYLRPQDKIAEIQLKQP